MSEGTIVIQPLSLGYTALERRTVAAAELGVPEEYVSSTGTCLETEDSEENSTTIINASELNASSYDNSSDIVHGQLTPILLSLLFHVFAFLL